MQEVVLVHLREILFVKAFNFDSYGKPYPSGISFPVSIDYFCLYFAIVGKKLLKAALALFWLMYIKAWLHVASGISL